MKTTFPLSLSLFLSLALSCTNSFAFGIDKLNADLDVGINFKSVTSFTVFNDDSDNAVFVTAEGLLWQMGESGELQTTPTEEIQIYPSVMRIPAGGSTTFKVRYVGLPPSGEATYRVLFKEVSIPKMADGSQEPELAALVNSHTSVGTAVTVPVYVTDFTKKSDILNQISATFSLNNQAGQLVLDNHGDRHITIVDYRINGKASGKGLGVVLANLKRTFTLADVAAASSVDIKVSYKDQTKWVSAVTRP